LGVGASPLADGGGHLDSRGDGPLVAWASGELLRDSQGYATGKVAYVGTATGGDPPYAFSWDFGDQPGIQGASVVHTHELPGDYIAVLTANDTAGRVATSTVSLLVSTSASPNADVDVSPRIGAVPVHAVFAVRENLPGSWSFDWTFGDGGISTESDPSHDYATPGVYTARVRAVPPPESPEFTFALTVIVMGSDPQKVVAGADPEISGTCRPFTQNVSFWSEVGGGEPPYRYAWDFGEAGTSDVPDPTHTYTAAGVENQVALEVQDANGTVATTTLSYWTVRPSCPVPVDDRPVTYLAVAAGGFAIAAVGTVLVIHRRRRSRSG